MTPMKNAFSDTNRTDNPRKETTRLRALAIGFRLIMTAAPKPIMTRAKVQKRNEGITDYGFPILDWRSNSSRAGGRPIRDSLATICDRPSFLFVPLQHHSVHDAADLEQLLLVVHHFGAGKPGNRVVFAQENCLLRANFLAHAAENAADHVDIELTRKFLNLGETIARWNFTRLNLDRARWTDELA